MTNATATAATINAADLLDAVAQAHADSHRQETKFIEAAFAHRYIDAEQLDIADMTRADRDEVIAIIVSDLLHDNRKMRNMWHRLQCMTEAQSAHRMIAHVYQTLTGDKS